MTRVSVDEMPVAFWGLGSTDTEPCIPEVRICFTSVLYTGRRDIHFVFKENGLSAITW